MLPNISESIGLLKICMAHPSSDKLKFLIISDLGVFSLKLGWLKFAHLFISFRWNFSCNGPRSWHMEKKKSYGIRWKDKYYNFLKQIITTTSNTMPLPLHKKKKAQINKKPPQPLREKTGNGLSKIFWKILVLGTRCNLCSVLYP